MLEWPTVTASEGWQFLAARTDIILPSFACARWMRIYFAIHLASFNLPNPRLTAKPPPKRNHSLSITRILSVDLTKMASTTPPTPLSQRFTLELEFVLCLSNPQYLQFLAVNHPHLLNRPSTSSADADDSDASRFARYLQYLYAYWKTPQYVQYLTHPGATLRNLELLQHEQFRKDIIRPDVIAQLFHGEPEASLVVNESTQPDQD